MTNVIETGEFARVGVEEAGRNLSVVLRRRGIHRDANVSVQVSPPASEEEIAELKERGHLPGDAEVVYYDTATEMGVGTGYNSIEERHIDAAMGIAETLAHMREVDSARVTMMRNHSFGDFAEYVDSTTLLVRQQ